MSSNPQQSPPPEPHANDLAEFLRLKNCPACDYSLETLPPAGICPECGRVYNQRFAVLSGRGRGIYDNAASGTWRGRARQAIWIFILFFLFTRSRMFPQMWIWALTAALVLLAQLYAWLFSPQRPTMQLWLAPHGMAQILSTPEGRRAAFVGHDIALLIVPLCVAAILLQEWRTTGVILLAAIGVLFLFCFWVWLRRRRKRIREPIADLNYTPTLWPWPRLQRIDIKPLRSNRLRIRARANRYWHRILIAQDWVIDIEIPCPQSLAAHLSTQIRQWSKHPPRHANRIWKPSNN